MEFSQRFLQEKDYSPGSQVHFRVPRDAATRQLLLVTKVNVTHTVAATLHEDALDRMAKQLRVKVAGAKVDLLDVPGYTMRRLMERRQRHASLPGTALLTTVATHNGRNMYLVDFPYSRATAGGLVDTAKLRSLDLTVDCAAYADLFTAGTGTVNTTSKLRLYAIEARGAEAEIAAAARSVALVDSREYDVAAAGRVPNVEIIPGGVITEIWLIARDNGVRTNSLLSELTLKPNGTGARWYMEAAEIRELAALQLGYTIPTGCYPLLLDTELNGLGAWATGAQGGQRPWSSLELDIRANAPTSGARIEVVTVQYQQARAA